MAAKVLPVELAVGDEAPELVIGPDGRLRGIHRKVSAKGHAAEFLGSL